MSIHEKVHDTLNAPGALEIVEKTATKITYGASVGTVYFGFTVDEWGVIGIITGIVLGAATFGFNVWFRMKYQRPRGED